MLVQSQVLLIGIVVFLMSSSGNYLNHLMQLHAQVPNTEPWLFNYNSFAQGVQIGEFSHAQERPGLIEVRDSLEHCLKVVHHYELLSFAKLFIQSLNHRLVDFKGPGARHCEQQVGPKLYWRFILIPVQNIIFYELLERLCIRGSARLLEILLSSQSQQQLEELEPNEGPFRPDP